MKKTLIASAITLTLLTANPVAAADKPAYKKEEGIGFGTGLLTGALVGGPLGAVVGAIGGVFIGHSVGADEEVIALRSETEAQRLALNELDKENRSLLVKVEMAANNERQLKQVSYQQQMSGQSEHGLMMAFQFRSGSAEVESLYLSQLQKLARALKQLPDMHIDLAGYADSRGEEKNNLSLSQQRAEAIKQQLVTLGVNEERLQTRAMGEVAPGAVESFESNFFDRRVVLTLTPAKTNMAAMN